MTVRLGKPDREIDVAPAPGTLADETPVTAGGTALGTVWDDMVATLRERLGLDGGIEDAAIALSLTEIDRFVEPHARWQAAFDSTLGHWLALRGCDVQLAFAPLVGPIIESGRGRG